ncbi:hypothetical protein QE152_g4866 [Popillia japonica]|uniref:Chromo domain-containing protein n=1 Tax=Popillia japonica TaxID=7064 RepID=A0AAW1MX31_POPJA
MELFKIGKVQLTNPVTYLLNKVQLTNPVTYLLNDMNGDPILGSFYEQELQKASITTRIYLYPRFSREYSLKSAKSACHKSSGDPILGSFYEQELQKAKHEDAYLVEKVLRRKGNKVYVKWLGFPKTHNSWIDKTNAL